MKKLFYLSLSVLLLSTRLVSAHTHQTYRNVRFGYAIDYPSHLVPQGESANGDGQVFRAADAQLTVWGAQNALGQSLARKYEEDLRSHGASVSYKTLGRDFYVISGKEGDRVYYQKTIQKQGDGYLTFSFSYAEAKRAIYDPAVVEISKSFRNLADSAEAPKPLAGSPDGGVEVLGTYSHVKSLGSDEDPHVEGYEVQLYRQGEKFFGVFFRHQGMSGDPPRGHLQDVRYEAATGRLFFRAKLTLGNEFGPESGPEGRPSRDLFEFEGVLKPKKTLQGQLRRRDGYHPERPGETETISLKIDPADTKRQHELKPQSWEAWRREPLYRGPQW